MAQRISANALAALTEALATMFWYKNDLRTYMVAATGDTALVASLDWDGYKRRVADEFVQRLVGDQDRHRDLLLRLMVDVAAVNEFPKLLNAEDSEIKTAEAERAVSTLRGFIKPYEEELLERERAKERIKEVQAEAREHRHMADKLAELKARYEELVVMDDAQERGRRLEPLLRDLFLLFDLDPKAAFTLRGEQIDGSFSLGETHFLLEAKWTRDPSERRELDAFKGTIQNKIENTLGLFVSINGFQETAVELHSGHGSQMLLMTGADLYLVLDARVDLVELLKRKYRHASQTGEILLDAGALL
jgi:Restriction endonuclease